MTFDEWFMWGWFAYCCAAVVFVAVMIGLQSR